MLLSECLTYEGKVSFKIFIAVCTKVRFKNSVVQFSSGVARLLLVSCMRLFASFHAALAFIFTSVFLIYVYYTKVQ